MDSKLIHGNIGNEKGLSEPILMQLMQELNAEAVKCRDRTLKRIAETQKFAD